MGYSWNVLVEEYENNNNNSADNKLIIFSYFSQKVSFDISCKLSPEDIKAYFLEKLRKIFKKCRLLKFLPRMLSIKIPWNPEIISSFQTSCL